VVSFTLRIGNYQVIVPEALDFALESAVKDTCVKEAHGVSKQRKP
jgi:Zn finger protein HypA/HybF involved in hydrogenase expression